MHSQETALCNQAITHTTLTSRGYHWISRWLGDEECRVVVATVHARTEERRPHNSHHNL